MQTGDLDRRIKVLKKTTAKNAAQQLVESWPLERTRWMNRAVVTGGERWLQGQQVAIGDVVFTAFFDSYTRTIKPETYRLQDEDGTLYDLTAAFDRTSKRQWWIMLARQRVS